VIGLEPAVHEPTGMEIAERVGDRGQELSRRAWFCWPGPQGGAGYPIGFQQAPGRGRPTKLDHTVMTGLGQPSGLGLHCRSALRGSLLHHRQAACA
jgi:hypothetical protein